MNYPCHPCKEVLAIVCKKGTKGCIIRHKLENKEEAKCQKQK